MQYILLPGFSKSNEAWAEDMKRFFTDYDLKLKILKWLHWSDGGSFHISAERDRLNQLANGKKTVILAKSIGTRLIAEMIVKKQVEFDVVKLVLMGIPSQNKVYLQLLELVNHKDLVIIQNKKDNLQSFSRLKAFVGTASKDITLIEGDRNDHSYPEFNLFIKEIPKV